MEKKDGTQAEISEVEEWVLNLKELSFSGEEARTNKLNYSILFTMFKSYLSISRIRFCRIVL